MARMAVGLVLVTFLCGCLGENEDDGALDPAMLHEWLGGGTWNVYSQPSVGGFVYARRYEGGVEAAVFGEDRTAVRTLAGSLGVRI
jgi:hypothetical protein